MIPLNRCMKDIYYSQIQIAKTWPNEPIWPHELYDIHNAELINFCDLYLYKTNLKQEDMKKIYNSYYKFYVCCHFLTLHYITKFLEQKREEPIEHVALKIRNHLATDFSRNVCLNIITRLNSSTIDNSDENDLWILTLRQIFEASVVSVLTTIQ